jgi:hypothetical protein
MMRIALVTPGFTPEVGGIESYVQNLSVELNALGYAVDVLTQCLALTPFGRHLVREDVQNGKYVPEVHSRI